MTRCISSLLDDWTLLQKNNDLKKFTQDTFLAPLAHNCTNFVKTWDELCAFLPSFLLAPSHSFSLLPSFLLFLSRQLCLYFSPSLSLSFFLISLSRYILAWNLNIAHYWQTYWYSWMREAGDTKWDGRTSSSICWREHQPQFGLRPGGGSTAVRSMHLHSPQHLLYPFPHSPAPLFLYSSFGL